MIYGNMVGGASLAQTYILQDSDGNEIPAVLVESETVFDATANDIREGKTAATDIGVVVGEKFIPPYYTSVGCRLIQSGSEFSIPLPKLDAYNYTSLQCIICPHNNSISDSVSAERVVIDNNVYSVNSAIVISAVTKDADEKSVKLGIVNDSGVPYIIRYFTYKEEL